MEKYLWIWCLINTVCILLMLILFGTNYSINNDYLHKIDDNSKQIENIEYKIQKQDTILIINNINFEKHD